MNDICEYLLDVSTYCYSTSCISIAVSAANELGVGSSSNPMSVGKSVLCMQYGKSEKNNEFWKRINNS